jgi:hypothetical protein
VTKLGVFTLATGKPIYSQMAFALARSFRLWHAGSAIEFFLATDLPRHQLPEDLRDIKIIPVKTGQYGQGFEPKLHLDRIAPARQSLFVDADCLCVRSLTDAFDVFQGRSVSAIGREITDGEWSGDVATICRHFGVPALPRFNGGVYYLEPGEACSRVYETARTLLPQYDAIGFKRLRGFANDELLMSLAMARCGQKLVPETGTIMNTLLAGPGGIDVDVFRGRAVLYNPVRHKNHNPWYKLETMRPCLVHFLGVDTRNYPYGREVRRLELVYGNGWPIWLAALWTSISISVPAYASRTLKAIFRPIWHATFGARAMRPSERAMHTDG